MVDLRTRSWRGRARSGSAAARLARRSCSPRWERCTTRTAGPVVAMINYPGEQPYQDRSWGRYMTFRLENMEPGEYVSTDGVLSPRAVRYLADVGGAMAVAG